MVKNDIKICWCLDVSYAVIFFFPLRLVVKMWQRGGMICLLVKQRQWVGSEFPVAGIEDREVREAVGPGL